MSKLIVLNPFTLDVDKHSDHHGISFPDESLTVQADAEAADINYIVRQFGLTHELPYGLSVPTYDDFTDIPNDFHAAQNFIKASEDAFIQFPPEIRERFDNDPGKLLDFVSKAENYDEAAKLGIVVNKNAQGSEPPAPVPEGSDKGASAPASAAQSST